MNAAAEAQDLKKERILEAAHHRFLHYGYAKTTMNEIAGDLFMSKALLYYYFPDKSQLYIAVMQKVANEYLDILNDCKNCFSNLNEAFIFQVKTHHEFIVNNYNFFDFFRLNEQNLPDAIWEIVSNIHQSEMALLIKAIKTEVESGHIKPLDNPEEVVGLLLDALHGVRVNKLPYKKMVFPLKEHLDELYQKRLLLVDIFIKGLMYCVND